MVVSIEEIGIDVFKYRKWSTQSDMPTGPVRSDIPLKDIFVIIYPDNTREYPNPLIIENLPKRAEQQPVEQVQVTTEQVSQQESVSEPETEEDTTFSIQGFVFGGKVGYFIPWDEYFREYKGSGFMGGLLLGYWEGRWGGEFEVKYYSSNDVEITLLPITFTTYYNVYKSGNFETYVGFGVGGCPIWDFDEFYKTAFEFHSTGGIRFAPFYLEVSFRSIPLIDDDINLGGILISGGVFF